MAFLFKISEYTNTLFFLVKINLPFPNNIHVLM